MSSVVVIVPTAETVCVVCELVISVQTQTILQGRLVFDLPTGRRL